MKKLIMVIALAFVGANSYAKGGCASGDAAKLLQTSVGLGSSFSISGTLTEGKDSMSLTDTVTVSGTAASTQVTFQNKTYTGAICFGKGHAHGTVSGEGKVASVTVSGKSVTIRSGNSTFRGTAN
jgi:hypothetical protein